MLPQCNLEIDILKSRGPKFRVNLFRSIAQLPERKVRMRFRRWGSDLKISSDPGSFILKALGRQYSHAGVNQDLI
jgi:hypothetical protein